MAEIMATATVLRRPSADEQAILARPEPRLFGWWTGIVSAICAAACVFLVLVMVATLLEGPPDWAVRATIAVAGVAALGWYVGAQVREHRRFGERRRLSKQALAADQVRSTTYTIREAIEVEESEDEGPSYYLLLDDNRTLFLSGQYLHEPVEMGFPWRSFEVVEIPAGGWVLTLKPHGPSVGPIHTRPPFTVDELADGSIPQDRAILELDFGALRGGMSG